MPPTPAIVPLPPRQFAGLPARFISAASPAATHLKVIPKLWRTFNFRVAETRPVEPGIVYGLCACDSPLGEKSNQPDELFYLAAVEVVPGTKPPPGMVIWPSAGGTYAKFVHRGRIQGIGTTMRFIHEEWLPGSGYALAPGPDIERYDRRFDPASDASHLEIFIPVTQTPGA